jgi:hypothetical protein
MSEGVDKERTIELMEYTNILSTTGGRNAMHRILKFTGLDDRTFDKDERLSALNDGKREAGLWLRDELKAASPDKYLIMLKEHIDE